MEDIVLVGFGGHAQSVIDSIEKNKYYHIVGFTDIVLDKEYRGYKCLGTDDILQKYYDGGVKYAFVTVGYMGKGNIRDILYDMLVKIGFRLPAIVDPSATLAGDVIIGDGTFIGKKCVVNSAAQIGKMCIINTGAIVEHGNQIGDFTHIAVNSTLCGNVLVGDHSFIGANSTIIQDLKIGSKCIVGAGSTVLRDVPSCEKIYGIKK